MIHEKLNLRSTHNNQNLGLTIANCPVVLVIRQTLDGLLYCVTQFIQTNEGQQHYFFGRFDHNCVDYESHYD